MTAEDVWSLPHRNATVASVGKRARPTAAGSISCREESEECEKGPKVGWVLVHCHTLWLLWPSLEVASDLPSTSEST